MSTLNSSMAERVLTQITEHPETHSQTTFEGVGYDDDVCGTTRCIAGWAVYFWAQDRGIEGGVMDLAEAYVAEVGVATILDAIEYGEDSNGDGVEDIEAAAAHILGLKYSESHPLFYNLNNYSALRQFERHVEEAKR